jgi:hypothetical protein
MTRIPLLVPEIDPEDVPEPGEPVTPLLIWPEGMTPGRETPGFFVVRLNGEWLWPDTAPPDGQPQLPRQFLSLDAVHSYLTERYGAAPPLRLVKRVPIAQNGRADFPVVWAGTRGKGKARVPVRVRYIGSFRYWDGRLVDPTKVGTAQEFH